MASLFFRNPCNFLDVNQTMKTKVENTVKICQSMLKSGIHILKLLRGSVMVLPYTITKWIFVHYMQLRLAFLPLENSSGIFIPDLNVLEIWILFPLKFVDIELNWQSGYCDREYVSQFFLRRGFFSYNIRGLKKVISRLVGVIIFHGSKF